MNAHYISIFHINYINTLAAQILNFSINSNEATYKFLLIFQKFGKMNLQGILPQVDANAKGDFEHLKMLFLDLIIPILSSPR